MKVALVGNMNNMGFAIVRYLRDRDVDAHLLIYDDEQKHFHPSCDAFDLGYQAYTHELSWGSPSFFSNVPADRIRSDLKGYDLLFGCGSIPAFAHRIGRKLDAFIPYGSDIAELPFFGRVRPRRGSLRSFVEFPLAQRAGIRSCRTVVGERAPLFEARYRELGCTGERVVLPMPLLYLPQYEKISHCYDRSHWHHEFRRIRDSHDLVVFHHARHVWKSATPTSANNKGNDRLLVGFKQFLERNPSVDACIVLAEYGVDVVASRQLIDELGISERVFWFPQMPRKEIMIGMSLADIGTGEFVVGWNAGGTMYETLAMGKPLLHYRDDRKFPGHDLYPLMNASTSKQICEKLSDFVARPEHYREVGASGRAWLERNANVDPLYRLIEAARNSRSRLTS